MTIAQIRVMDVLYQNGRMPAAEVATSCGYADQRTAIHVLDALFRRNLATVDDEGRWHLTSKGVRKATGVKPRPRNPRVLPSDDGVIVTMREQGSGELNTITRPGKPEQALRDICVLIDGAAGDWRIVTISTPNSIYRDLQADRQRDTDHRVDPPEQAMLNKIGRRDLLETREDVAKRSAA